MNIKDFSFEMLNGKKGFISSTSIFHMERLNIGTLKITSGHIVAGDAIISIGSKNYFDDFVIKQGDYPVDIFVANINDAIDFDVNNKGFYPGKNDERISMAGIFFSNKKIETLKSALPKNESKIFLDKDEFLGYGVYSGSGSFYDRDTALLFDEEFGFDSTEFYSKIETSMKNNYKKTRDWGEYIFENGSNIITFSSGWGDGIYPSFWGLDKDGEPVCLVTTFMNPYLTQGESLTKLAYN